MNKNQLWTRPSGEVSEDSDLVLGEWTVLAWRVCAFLGPNWMIHGMSITPNRGDPIVTLIKFVPIRDNQLVPGPRMDLPGDVLVRWAGIIPETPELTKDLQDREDQLQKLLGNLDNQE